MANLNRKLCLISLDLETIKILDELVKFSETSRGRVIEELIWRVKTGVAPPLKILPRGRPKRI